MNIKQIVVNIPHSAPVPDDFSKWSNPCLARQEAVKWNDSNIDVVFRDPKNRMREELGIRAVLLHKTSLNRYKVDMERLENDPMEAQGQGIIYTATKDGKSIRTVSDEERESLMMAYRGYHDTLRNLTAADGTLLIDAHSYPSDYDEAGNATGEDVDVCIGFNDELDASYPGKEIIDLVKAHFEMGGYKVGLNRPFSNSILGSFGTPSIMIELNKRIYIDEKTQELRPDAYKLNYLISDLYGKLLSMK